MCCRRHGVILDYPIKGPINFQNIPDQHKTLLNGAIEAIEKLQSTPDITPEAKAALSDVKNQEQQLLAVNSLEPSIRIISSACQYTKPICDGVLGLINLLLSGGTIESNQESVFTLLAYLYCCVLFDSIKLSIPRIQNVLFFYRRCAANTNGSSLPFSEADIRQMSSFLSEDQPMQHELQQLIEHNVHNEEERNALLIEICNSLILFLEVEKDLEEQCRRKYLYCLTALLILLDSLVPCGIFVKESRIHIFAAVQVFVHSRVLSRECLSILRYSSRTFAFPSTQKNVRKMIVKATD